MNRRTLRLLQPFFIVMAVVLLSGLLIFAIHFGALDLQWITFLSGVLAASLLAMVVRATRAEFFAARRLARVSILQQRLGREQKHRDELERAIAAAKTRLHFADEALPVMVAYVDLHIRYRYHNRAFGDWLGLRKEKIDGQHMRDVHGRRAFRELEAAVAEAIQGRPVQFEWTQRMPGTPVYRLSIQYLPQFDDKAKPVGFYAVIGDITERTDVQAVPPAGGMLVSAGAQTLPALAPVGADAAESMANNDIVVDTGLEEAAASRVALDRIVSAITRGEFSLFYQPIRPLQVTTGLPEHYEIFVRLLEEEANLMPPGAFFPLAEEHGLLPQLDRWVVEHLLAWISSRKAAIDRGQVAFLNIAADTLCDADFPDFLEYQLRKNGVSGGALCFEITDTALNSHPGDVQRFVRSVKEQGCRLALSGFGRDGMSVDALKTCPLDFVKIHGSLVLALERNAGDIGTLLPISRISKVIGIKTVAEMVETQETISRLREAAVDFAQGFGVAKPQPLAALVSR